VAEGREGERGSSLNIATKPLDLRAIWAIRAMKGRATTLAETRAEYTATNAEGRGQSKKSRFSTLFFSLVLARYSRYRCEGDRGPQEGAATATDEEHD
jgi:hypothetical protein